MPGQILPVLRPLFTLAVYKGKYRPTPLPVLFFGGYLFVLRPDGSIISARVLQSSGLRPLDREALRAVRQGAPFINPPVDLINANGHIPLVPFYFIVSASRWF